MLGSLCRCKDVRDRRRRRRELNVEEPERSFVLQSGLRDARGYGRSRDLLGMLAEAWQEFRPGT